MATEMTNIVYVTAVMAPNPITAKSTVEGGRLGTNKLFVSKEIGKRVMAAIKFIPIASLIGPTVTADLKLKMMFSTA